MKLEIVTETSDNTRLALKIVVLTRVTIWVVYTDGNEDAIVAAANRKLKPAVISGPTEIEAKERMKQYSAEKIAKGSEVPGELDHHSLEGVK